MINLIFNILFGLSVGLLISFLFINRNIYHGPNSKDICKKIFINKSKCYKLIPILTKCSFLSYHY
jgi:hypothetical protein